MSAGACLRLPRLGRGRSGCQLPRAHARGRELESSKYDIFYPKSGFIKRIEHRVELFQMLRKSFRPDENVVDVYEAVLPIHVCEN